jgi:hypothetical protein
MWIYGDYKDGASCLYNMQVHNQYFKSLQNLRNTVF